MAMMKMEKAGKDWADSLTDEWCCISCLAFLGKVCVTEIQFQFFPRRPVLFDLGFFFFFSPVIY